MTRTQDYPVRSSSTLSDLVAGIEKAAGKQAVLNRQPDQPGDVPLTCAATEKAKRLLGFEAKIPLETGLKRYFEWLATDEAKSWR